MPEALGFPKGFGAVVHIMQTDEEDANRSTGGTKLAAATKRLLQRGRIQTTLESTRRTGGRTEAGPAGQPAIIRFGGSGSLIAG